MKTKILTREYSLKFIHKKEQCKYSKYTYTNKYVSQNGISIYRILVSQRNVWRTDTRNAVDRTWKHAHYTESK